MSAGPSLYHRKPPDFHGSVLYPLNVLRDVSPDLYRRQRAKYDGREGLLGQRVPYLDCLWNDVIHLSPVHPGEVAGLARREGLLWREAEWFEIDPGAMGFTARNTAVFRYREIDVEESIPAEEFERFDVGRLGELAGVPERTREYYRRVEKGSGRYFIFAGVPHVLHRGVLDVGDVRVVIA